MKAPPPSVNPHWHPLRSAGLYDPPNTGTIVAWRHAAWRVVEVRDIPEDLWTADDLQRIEHYTAASREKFKPRALTLRPVGNSDVKIRAGQDQHVGIGGRWSYGGALSNFIHIYPDEHYPVCACCGEPAPCREKEIERELERTEKRTQRYEMAGVCPDCSEPVTKRQKCITFTENLEVPLGPPVTFHLRGQCYDGALRYEQRWVMADPRASLHHALLSGQRHSPQRRRLRVHRVRPLPWTYRTAPGLPAMPLPGLPRSGRVQLLPVAYGCALGSANPVTAILDWLRSWRAFCGCCGRAYLWRPNLPDPFWCSACRAHVLPQGYGFT